MRHFLSLHFRNLIRNKYFLPLFLIVLFVGWRLAVYSLTHPVFFHDDIEEVYRGAVAREMTLGTPYPIWNYRRDNYAGGFYVIVTLLVPVLKFFNFSMLGIRALGIFFTGATLLVWYAILNRWVNKKTAVIFSLLYIFAPFRYIIMSSFVIGDHAETALLSALTVYLLFHLREMPNHHRTGAFVALGMILGFSLWFAYIYAVTVLTLAAFVVLNHGKKVLLKRSTALVGFGFFTGFSFWVFFNVLGGFRGLYLYDKLLWSHFDFSNLMKFFISWREFFIFKLLTHPEVPPIWFPEYNLLLLIYVGIFALLFGGTLLGLTKFYRKDLKIFASSPIFFSGLYVLVFALIQQCFEMVGLRFLIPVFPFALAVISFGLAQIYSRRWAWSVAGISSLISLAFLCTVLRFDSRYTGEYLSRKAYANKTLFQAQVIRPRIEWLVLKELSKINRLDRNGYLLAYARTLDLKPETAEGEVITALRIVPPQYHKYFLYLCGRELTLRTENPALPYIFFKHLRTKDPQTFKYLVRGSFAALFNRDRKRFDLDELRQIVPKDLWSRLSAYEGFCFAEEHIKEISSSPLVFNLMMEYKMKGMTRRQQERFLWGVGRFLLRHWSHDPQHSLVSHRFIESLSTENRISVYRGIAQQMLRKHFFSYSSPFLWVWNDFFYSLSPTGKQELVQGLKSAMDRMGVLKEALPFEKMTGVENYWR